MSETMNPVLRAKMIVTSVVDWPTEKDLNMEYLAEHPEIVIEKTTEIVCLSAVYGEEGNINKEWSDSTPSGTLNLTINNKNAWGRVQEGDYVFVDITPTTREG